jgi:hypothetical protein
MSFAAFGGTGSYVGARNDNGGFSHRSRPGTMSNSDGNTGTWWAVADPSAGGDA